MVCGEEKEKEVMFNKIVVENVEVGNGNKVIDVGKFPATKSKVVYGVLLPESAK